MSKANGRPARLEVGAEVVRTLQTFYEADAKGKAEHRPCGAASCISIRGACFIRWNFRHAEER